MKSEWICSSCQRSAGPYNPPFKCPVCHAEGSYYLKHTDEGPRKTPKEREDHTRAVVAFLAGAAAGLYVWSETKSGEMAIGAAIAAGVIASFKVVSKLIGWAFMLGLLWLLYVFWTNT